MWSPSDVHLQDAWSAHHDIKWILAHLRKRVPATDVELLEIRLYTVLSLKHLECRKVSYRVARLRLTGCQHVGENGGLDYAPPHLAMLFMNG